MSTRLFDFSVFFFSKNCSTNIPLWTTVGDTVSCLCAYWAFSLSALCLQRLSKVRHFVADCIWGEDSFGLSPASWGGIPGLPPVSAFLVCSQAHHCIDTRPAFVTPSSKKCSVFSPWPSSGRTSVFILQWPLAFSVISVLFSARVQCYSATISFIPLK